MSNIYEPYIDYINQKDNAISKWAEEINRIHTKNIEAININEMLDGNDVSENSRVRRNKILKSALREIKKHLDNNI